MRLDLPVVVVHVSRVPGKIGFYIGQTCRQLVAKTPQAIDGRGLSNHDIRRQRSGAYLFLRRARIWRLGFEAQQKQPALLGLSFKEDS